MKHRSISRRLILRSAAAFAAVIAVARPFRLLAQAKASQQAVRYQDSPKGGKRCAECRFFVEPVSCQRVEGEISPNGWCTLFAPK